jgi:hypothetical protein
MMNFPDVITVPLYVHRYMVVVAMSSDAAVLSSLGLKANPNVMYQCDVM